MTPRIFAALRLALLAAATLFGASPLEFIHITDTHVIDPRGIHPDIAAQRRMYGASGRNLREFLTRLGSPKEARPAFVLITGDLIDGFEFQGDRPSPAPPASPIGYFQEMIRNSPLRLFLTLGNHDVQRYAYTTGADKPSGDEAAAPAARAEWKRTIGSFRSGTYYRFVKKVGPVRYRLVILDDGSAKDRDYAEAQLQWLAHEIASAGDDRIIVAMHIPLGLTAYAKRIQQALEPANRLVLVIAGHRHSNAIEDIDFTPGLRVTQVRTAIFATDPTHFRSIRLYEDRIEISKPGDRRSTERVVSVGPK